MKTYYKTLIVLLLVLFNTQYIYSQWVQTGALNVTCVRSSLAVSGANLFYAPWGGYGVFLSTNNGTSWTNVSAGLPTSAISFCVSGTNLFAGIYWTQGVWRRPLSEMITSVKEISGKNPQDFSLHQNYPNPFNPSTKIQYSIAERSIVTLKIYDMLGREVADIVNGIKEAGNYEVNFDASKLVSGLYVYTLRAGNFTVSRKMILMK